MSYYNSIPFISNYSNIVCGLYYTISIDCYGNLWSVGSNEYGKSGHDKSSISHIFPPKKIPNLKNIKMVSCGFHHTVCLDYFNSVFSFGQNTYGQLGIGKDKTILRYTNIPQKLDLPSIKLISCGVNFTVCLTTNGYIYSFGNGNNGQLGIGNNNNSSIPIIIPDLYDIEFVECGGDFVFCSTFLHEYYSWGNGFDGQLAHGNRLSYDKPKQCFNIPNNIISIKCSTEHTLFLTIEGHVYSCGNNYHGKLGFNDDISKSITIPTKIQDLPKILKIECGFLQSLCIDYNLNLWVFGYNLSGQLGLGDKHKRCKPTLNTSLKNIIGISTGGVHTLVKTTKDEIWAFGNNMDSQIGIEKSLTNNYQLIPTKVFSSIEYIWTINFGKSTKKSARK